VPAGLLETIIEYRAYARTKAVFDAQGQTTAPDTPLMVLVKEITFELVQEEIAHQADG